jgi:hypothetical protein
MAVLAPPVQVVASGAPPFVQTPSGAPPFVVTTGPAPPITIVASGAPPITLLNDDGSIWAPGPPAAPVNTVLPVISGTPTVGQTISTTNGTWTGSPSPTFTYQWKRAGGAISGATLSTYTLVPADTAALITVTVTATNSQGSASATSPSFGTINLTPTNAVAPAITGTPSVGQTLTSTTGTWAGTPVPTYVYQWKRDTTNVGTNASTYTLVTADIGATMTCVVTGSNTAGSASATSNALGPVTAALLSIDFTPPAGDEAYKGIIFNDAPWITGSWENTYASFGIYANTLGHPAALRYSGVHNRTYVSYQDRTTDPEILYFDHDTQTWSAVTKIGVNPIAPDDHGPPTLEVDASGFLYAFYGSHSTAQKVKKSNSAEDISAWTAKTDVDAFASYPQPHMRASGTMQVFYRRATSSGGGGPNFSFKTTSDGATTWSTATDVVYFAAATDIYGNVHYESDTIIHLAWFKWDTPDQTNRKNVYYAKSTNGGTSWTKADGTALTLPISEAAAEKVYDSESLNDQAYVWDVKVDAGGKPVILFNTGTGATATYKCARWSGSAWVISTISATHWVRNLGALDCVSATIYDAYITKGSFTGRGGELMRYRSTDSGATWTFAESLKPGATFKGFSPQVVRNYSADVKVVWGVGYPGASSVAFYGNAPAKIGIDAAMSAYMNVGIGWLDQQNTEQFRSAPASMKAFSPNSEAFTPPLAAPLATTKIEFYTYISSTSGRANTIGVLDSGDDVASNSGPYVKFEGGIVYAYNGSAYIDTTLTYGTGWVFVRIVPRGTNFDLTVGATTKTNVANRNTITNVNKLYLNPVSFDNWYDDIVVT